MKKKKDKLKTLKDFGETCYEHIGERVYTREEIKQEAIKWIKNRLNNAKGDLQIEKIENKKIVWNYQPFHYIDHDKLIRIQGSINDFILFFNITEEDLK